MPLPSHGAGDRTPTSARTDASPAPRSTVPGLKTPACRRPTLAVLTGNPNCGKTTLFNALTGLRARVANYAGVTVERKEGRLAGADRECPVTVLDLPGTYSLSAQSLDEQIARDVLLQRLADVPPPDLVIVVVDASNLERNLYYATQVIELGYPTLIALNMMDVARDIGHLVDASRLAEELGVPVFPMVASSHQGVLALRARILALARQGPAESVSPNFCRLPDAFETECASLERRLTRLSPTRGRLPACEARLWLTDERGLPRGGLRADEAIERAVQEARQRLDRAGIDWRTVAIEARYARAAAIHQAVVQEPEAARETSSDRLDRVLTHPVWGLLIFFAVMALMFQSIFTFARLPMEALEHGVNAIGDLVGRWIPPGDFHSLLVDGVIAGVGAVVVFLPQICLLFLFIGLLEDTGYMARAAFLMDRLMSKVGLHGKSFIPLLSSFACAIPGIMATRTIENPKDRLVTILVAPLMSCSARLPVYTLLIAACIPDRRLFGLLRLPGLTLLALYLLGIIAALVLAWVFKKTLLQGHTPLLIIELPPYRRPLLTTLLRHMWDRAQLFLQRAGTVILGINILLWFLASYPRNAEVERRDRAERQSLAATASPGGPPGPLEMRQAKLHELDRALAGGQLRGSFIGRLGRFIEPAIRPLGFDWKIGIGIISSFAAREVFVSTMSVVYNVGGHAEGRATNASLAQTLRDQRRPDGTPVYTALTGVTLMVFYVAALQCASTIAVVRRETNTWKWPLFQLACFGGLAWVLAFVTRQGGRLLGLQ